MFWTAWLRFWFAPPLPPPAPRWTPLAWEFRCVGHIYLRHRNGYLSEEQALMLVAAVRSEHRADPLVAGVVARGSLAGIYVPAVLSWRRIVA